MISKMGILIIPFFDWASCDVGKLCVEDVWVNRLYNGGIHISNVCKELNSIFRKDNVNIASICLECETRKNIQLFLNHMKNNFLYNGYKDIINGIVCLDVFIAM